MKQERRAVLIRPAQFGRVSVRFGSVRFGRVLLYRIEFVHDGRLQPCIVFGRILHCGLQRGDSPHHRHDVVSSARLAVSSGREQGLGSPFVAAGDSVSVGFSDASDDALGELSGAVALLFLSPQPTIIVAKQIVSRVTANNLFIMGLTFFRF